MDKITAEQVLLAAQDMTSKSTLREKIETKIAEFAEKLPANGRLVHEHQQDAYSIIVGLQMALDILDEEE